MPKQRTYRTVGLEFLDSAPATGTLRQALPVSAAAAFRSFEDPDSWPQWIGAIKKVVWTSPKPFGVGTTRDIHLPGGVVAERFLEWDDGSRMAFIFTGGTPPLFAAFAEDYILESTGEDSCNLTWRWGIEFAGPARFATSVLNSGVSRAGKKSLSDLAGYLAANRDLYAA